MSKRVYVMSYFKTASEALHLAVSEDGFDWVELRGGAPMLVRKDRSVGIRDPFVGVGPDGQFLMTATDGWRSDCMIVSTSPDLVHWAAPHRVDLIGHRSDLRGVWAPEFFFDPDTQTYHILWSSMYVTDHQDQTEVENNTQDLRIWACQTKDFLSFTPASLLFDPGYTVIDATTSPYAPGTWLLAFKDERGTNDLLTEYKGVRTALFRPARGQVWDVSDICTPTPSEGPTLYRVGEEWVLLYDRFLQGQYGGSTSRDGRHWAPTHRVKPPPGARHASVLQLPEEQLAVLLASEEV